MCPYLLMESLLLEYFILLKLNIEKNITYRYLYDVSEEIQRLQNVNSLNNISLENTEKR